MSAKRKPILGEMLVRYRPATRHIPAKVDELPVVKVGTKYFYVGDESWHTKFMREDWGIDGSGNGRINWPAWLFESREELAAYLEAGRIRGGVTSFFRDYGWETKLTQEQFLAIHAIILP